MDFFRSYRKGIVQAVQCMTHGIGVFLVHLKTVPEIVYHSLDVVGANSKPLDL